MKVIRRSEISGEIHARELNVTAEQLRAYEYEGVLLQNAFPQLNAEEREFIKSGITGAEWDELFGDDE